MRLRYWGCSRKRLPMPSKVSECCAWDKRVLYRYIAWSQNLALQDSGEGRYPFQCPMCRRPHASYSTSRYCCPLGQAAERATLCCLTTDFPLRNLQCWRTERRRFLDLQVCKVHHATALYPRNPDLCCTLPSDSDL